METKATSCDKNRCCFIC